MKITARLSTTEYSFIEAEFDTLEQFKTLYPQIKTAALVDKSVPELEASQNEPSYEPTPEEQAYALGIPPETTPSPVRTNTNFYAPKVVGGKCPKCPTGKFVQSPKTSKIFCDQKCFANKTYAR